MILKPDCDYKYVLGDEVIFLGKFLTTREIWDESSWSERPICITYLCFEKRILLASLLQHIQII
jgi:hypothetical protein